MGNKIRKLINKINLLDIIGTFLFIFGIFSMIFSVFRGEPIWVFWLCYVGMIIIGIGIFMRSKVLIISQLNILTIPLLIWDIDFIYQLITGNNLWGVAGYFFNELIIFARIISLEHLFLLPLTFTALYLINKKQINKKTNNKLKNKINLDSPWIISILQTTILYFLVKFLNDGTGNVNCVRESCWDFLPTFSNYFTIEYFIVIFSIILFTNFVIIKLFNKFTTK